MNYGKHLKKGDTIGITAVSSACLNHQEITDCKAALESLDYRVQIAPNCFDNHFHFAGDDDTRAHQLECFFSDPTIDAIIALRGGYGAIRILDKINYDIIKENPKIFVGFSDVTSLQMAFYTKADLITFQGPMLTRNFNPDLCKTTMDSLFNMISNPEHHLICNEFNVLHEGFAEGVLLGGNLITFMTLMGTPYEIDFTDKILFFEEIDEFTYAIDRVLTQLLISQKLNTVKGIIFGDFNDCKQRYDHEEKLENMLKERLGHLNIPIITDVPSGHCEPMLTIPLGAKIQLDTKTKTISLLEKVIQ